ncbi:MAG: site-specific integrase [Candidatus Methanomethylicia archaeon]|nr:site-specific integrase [Candidatus Methanomethylicia archaeon]
MTSEQRLYLKDVPSWNDVERIISSMIRMVRQDQAPLRDLCIIGLLATTGMRTSELLLLKKSDFNFEANILTIQQLKKKGDYLRQTVLSSDLKPFLLEYMKDKQNDERVFDLSRRQVLNITHKYSEMILGKRMRNHAFRHAYAIRILEKTRDVELCRRLIGHTRLETVKIYLDFSIGDRVKEVSDAIKIDKK